MLENHVSERYRVLFLVIIEACVALLVSSTFLFVDGYAEPSLPLPVPQLLLLAGLLLLGYLYRSRVYLNDILFLKLSAWRNVIAASLAVFGLGLSLSLTAVLTTDRYSQKEAVAQFSRLADKLASETQRRITIPRYGLLGARGVYAASKSVERQEFSAYVRARDLPEEFPGVLGFGFIQRVARENLAAFVAAERLDEAPDFSIRTSCTTNTLYVVKFLEPMYEPAFGLDISCDPIRLNAAESAMRTGLPTLSQMVTLINRSPQESGFVYFVPVYHKGAPTATVSERQAALYGLIYAVISAKAAFENIGEVVENELSVRAYEGSETSADRLLLDTAVSDETTSPSVVLELSRSPRFHDRRQIKIGTQTWTLDIAATDRFSGLQRHGSSYLVGLGSLLLSFLASVVTWSLAGDRLRAQELARRMTINMAIAKATAEDALREMLALSQTLETHSTVLISNASGSITEVNDSFCRISGYKREEILGLSHTFFVDANHAESRLRCQEMNLHLRNSQPWQGELQCLAQNSTPFWVECIVCPFLDAEGELQKHVFILNDITQRKLAEVKIIESERRFRTIIEGIDDVIIWEYQPQSEVFTYVSPQAHRLGYPLAQWFDRGFWSAHLHPDDREYAENFCKHETLAGRNHRFQYRMIAADGTEIWCDDFVTIEHTPDGNFLLRGVIVDITERKRFERDLLEARNADQAASVAKSAFLANMSHEIRTPLTAILGYADLLVEGEESGALSKHHLQTVDTIRNAGKHLLTVINDILDISKIEAGKMTVECIETPLIGVLQEVETLLRPRALGKGIQLSVRLATPLPDRIQSDPTRFRQILMNLAGNAIKFTEIGEVRIVAESCTQDGFQKLRIDVADTGTGLTETEATRLFVPFSQADSTVTRKHGGTGLGLTICRRLAELMGGSVFLHQSTLGKGSTFRMDLPLVETAGARIWNDFSASQAATVIPLKGASPRLSGRILLAEDGPDNQKLIAYHLKKAGATVDIAENGLVALTMFETACNLSTAYDLLLTDMQMPEMDGYTLTRTLREKGVLLPIVALTAHAMAEDRQRCVDAGCDDYASKPIDRAALIQTCAQWLEKSRASQSWREAS